MYQPVRLAALERRYLDNRDESLSGQAAHYGKGPFRWVALSGDPEDIYRTDEAILELFPEDAGLRRWITMARQKIHFQGLPARICWLGYGQRDNALLNTASGATWVSVHHGGGVGIGYSLHAGQVIVADGTSAAAEPIARVLTNDPGSGVMRQGKRA